jgi:CDP-paratose 2-epimerase
VDIGDVRDPALLHRVMEDAAAVYHFAAQVAVTHSLSSPVHDFEVNARGTLNVLEAVRALPERPMVLFTSTNKVYGALHDVPLRRAARRYEPDDAELRRRGVSEDRPLDFHSPYGCSKGCADQYMLDYARCFGVQAVVFRMSCIYGPHQQGTEDQGWVAHFMLRARAGEDVTIFGDGMQVRDILHVHDLVEAFLLAQDRVSSLRGQAFNIGGGPANTMSLLELLDVLREQHGLTPHVHFAEPRLGDQRYFVSDTSRFGRATGWQPRTPAVQGVGALLEWFAQQGAAHREPDGYTGALALRGHDAPHAVTPPLEVSP